MSIDIKKLKEEIEKIANETEKFPDMELNEARERYHKWYGKFKHIIDNYCKNRATEIEELHNEICDRYVGVGYETDYSLGPDLAVFIRNLVQMKGVILGILGIIDLKALEVAALITGDLVEDELEEAKIMLGNRYYRCAGAIAGVALEAHLKLLLNQSNVEFDKKDGIVALANKLRMEDFITLGDEKKCIAMADTRNNCDHKRDKDPEKGEVQELIDDVARFTKRVQVI